MATGPLTERQVMEHEIHRLEIVQLCHRAPEHGVTVDYESARMGKDIAGEHLLPVAQLGLLLAVDDRPEESVHARRHAAVVFGELELDPPQEQLLPDSCTLSAGCGMGPERGQPLSVIRDEDLAIVKDN